jgi:hypothetical protein
LRICALATEQEHKSDDMKRLVRHTRMG